MVVGSGFYITNRVQSDENAITNLSSQISSLQNRPPVTITTTEVSVSAKTTTSTSTVTTSVYPVPSNVTVLFTKLDGTYDYTITYGSSSYTGSSSQQMRVPLNNLFAGTTITINVSTTSIGGCRVGETVTVELFLNGSIVAQTTTQCGSNPAIITYTV